MNTHVKELSSANWDAEVRKASGPVLVDFWAPWCAPCRALMPTIEQVARDVGGLVKVGTLNVDQHSEIAERYNIRSIPALLLFRDGQLIDRRTGGGSKADLVGFVSAERPSIHVGTPGPGAAQ
jgi:thioredoxin 1